MNLTLGRKIKELRKAKGLNQTEMAEKLGVHLQTISRYERGELTPGPEVLSVLAEKFQLDLNTLLQGETIMVKELATGYAAPKEVKSKEEAITRIAELLKGMPEEKVLEILRYTEEKKELLFYQAIGRGYRSHTDK